MRRRVRANHMVLHRMCSALLQLQGDRAEAQSAPELQSAPEALQSASLRWNLQDAVPVAPHQCLPGCHHSQLWEVSEVLHQCQPLHLLLDKSVKAPSQHLLRFVPWHHVQAPEAFPEGHRWGSRGWISLFKPHRFLAVIFDDAVTAQRAVFGHW